MRNTDQPDANEPPQYAVRFVETAQEEIDQEYVRLAGIRGVDVAEEWEAGLLAAVRTLATYPERWKLADENEQFQQVRPGLPLFVMLYRRTRTSPAWRILFTIHEADANDQPTLRVRHIRHGARAPMTFWPPEDE